MTLTDYKKHPLKEGDNVKTFDDAKGGMLEIPIWGKVTGTSEEGFDVIWDDFKEIGWETEYEWSKITIKGDEIIESGERNEMSRVDDKTLEEIFWVTLSERNFHDDLGTAKKFAQIAKWYASKINKSPIWVKAIERLPGIPNPLPENTEDERGILFINRTHSACYFWYPSYGTSPMPYITEDGHWVIEQYEWLDEK